MVNSAWAKRSLLLAAAGLGLALTACASSNPFSNSGNDSDRTFMRAAQTWDLNKDSTVTCDEWKQYVATLFREADNNGDGALDAAEYTTIVKNDRLFELANTGYFDANGDGRVTLEEMSNKPNRAFALLDKNSDCQIDRTETVHVITIEKAKDTGGDKSMGRGPGP